jgi:hypothetical protein
VPETLDTNSIFVRLIAREDVPVLYEVRRIHGGRRRRNDELLCKYANLTRHLRFKTNKNEASKWSTVLPYRCSRGVVGYLATLSASRL